MPIGQAADLAKAVAQINRLRAEKDYAAAIPLAEECRDYLTKQAGESHPAVANAERVLAELREAAGVPLAAATEPEAAAPTAAAAANRRIRVFISSTFRDMIEERDALMTHTWPALRRLCQDRHVELVEVDLRWGIAESQSTRRETLKLCLDEIRACRPFFIGLLGERYGWVPGDDAFTADLKEEQPWLRDIQGKSVTEMEILHGVLNDPAMAGRAFFYFRDPAYARGRGPDFLSESDADAGKQAALKTLIRTACTASAIPLHENYADPGQLAARVMTDLSAAIETEFPKSNAPDPLTREAQDHEAFAEIRRRTYIGRAEYVEALDRHASGDGGPLVLLGDSGGGKSALLANWLAHWRQTHPRDLIIQHYIGGTADSSDHWRLMIRLMAEIKRWSGDPATVPTKHDEVLKELPLWLTRAKARATRLGVRVILVVDALNQLDDRDHARLLGWLPDHPFTGRLRLIVSTLPGAAGTDDPLAAIQQRRWPELRVQPLTVDERRQMIAGYLARFGKTLDEHRLVRLASAAPASNPLYLKILLDDLRVTGTYEHLDRRLTEYLAAADIATLLQHVLARYQRDYERDRPGLVAEAMGLVYASRRGLSETELLQLLRPADQERLPPAIWTPLRAALEDSLVDRGGILNFAHDFLRTAVATAFVPDEATTRLLRLRLADDFEAQPVTARSCDELPWLLWQAESPDRLRTCLLNIDRFLEIRLRDQEELMRYWVWLKEERQMGQRYLGSFEQWSSASSGEQARIATTANRLAIFLDAAALHADAEPLMRRALAITEQRFGPDHPDVATDLNNLANLLHASNRLAEAEPLLRRALAIVEAAYGPNHPDVAPELHNLAVLLKDTNRSEEAEPLYRRALAIDEQSRGPDHPDVARDLNNIAVSLYAAHRLAEAEPLYRRALAIDERTLGPGHPDVARDLNNLGALLYADNRPAEAEAVYRRALAIDEQCYGPEHPDVARGLNNLALLLQDTNRPAEAEALGRRALAIWEKSLGEDNPNVAIALVSLAQLFQATGQLGEAEPLMRRALEIAERTMGRDHPDVAVRLNSLAGLLLATRRLAEAEPLLRRALEIEERTFGSDHPDVARILIGLAEVLQSTRRFAEAEPLMRRALGILEPALGGDHPDVAIVLNNLAGLLQDTHRFAEAEPLMRRALVMLIALGRVTGNPPPQLGALRGNYVALLQDMGRSQQEIAATLRAMD